MPYGRIFVLVASIAIASPISLAQTIPASGRMHLVLDCAKFRGADDNHTLVEVYYAISQIGLSHARDSAGYAGTADLTLVAMKHDTAAFAQRWFVPSHVPDTSSLREGMNLVGIQSMELGPGNYTLEAISRDRRRPENADTVKLKLPVALFRTDRPVLSDIEFATSVRQGEHTGPFYKNTLTVIPNVDGIYSETQSCYVYAELYNLMTIPGMAEYTLRRAVYDAVGREVIAQEHPRKRGGESSVLVDYFPVENLRSGTYTLQLAILDTSGKALTQRARRFFVYNRKLGVDSSLLAGARDVAMPEYAGMDEKELDSEFDWARYESTDAEKAQFKSIKGVDAKRKFMSSFWRRRPPERRDQYLTRVEFANKNYRAFGRDGFRSDRGRVYIVYGPPDEIERHPSESESKPYEIWKYNSIEGGVIFVFVLKNAGGDYELVHSTARDELHDENWDREGITR